MLVTTYQSTRYYNAEIDKPKGTLIMMTSDKLIIFSFCGDATQRGSWPLHS